MIIFALANELTYLHSLLIIHLIFTGSEHLQTERKVSLPAIVVSAVAQTTAPLALEADSAHRVLQIDCLEKHLMFMRIIAVFCCTVTMTVIIYFLAYSSTSELHALTPYRNCALFKYILRNRMLMMAS